MVKKGRSIVKQDTSTKISRDKSGQGKITPWGAVASITDSISNVINVLNREKNITKRVKYECHAAIEIARSNVDKIKIQHKAFKQLLKDRKRERLLLKENLDNFWKEAQNLENIFNQEEMKKDKELLDIYLRFKMGILSKIDNILFNYYQRNTSTNLMIGK